MDFVLSLSISRCLSVVLLSPSISRCLDEGFHFDATLENWMLRFRSHLSHFTRSISRCFKDLNSDCAFHNSPGCKIHPMPNSSSASISPSRILLLVFFPASTFGFVFLIWTEIAVRKHRKIHDVTQTERMIPLITGEIAFRQHVYEMVLGVNIFDLNCRGPN